MKPHPKGTPVRVVNPDLLGVILKTETNHDEFGYRVGFGGKKLVDECDKQGAKTGKQIEVFEHERFFPLHEIEVTSPIDGPVTTSLSGTKAEALAQIGDVKNLLLAEALRYLVAALPGEKVSISVSIGAAFTISGSSWTDTPTNGEAK